MMLGIDTSCDETSIAIVDSQTRTAVVNFISSQVNLHAQFGGVVPELASRGHAENLGVIFQQALKAAQVCPEDLIGVAVTTSPGLMGCLLVGTSFAKALSSRFKKPLYAINHLEAHLFSPFLGTLPEFPFLGLVVSGGHTAFYHVQSFDEITLLGQTVDDAAGETYDKTAKMMGLGYPGGPIIDEMAQNGDDSTFAFTVPKVKMGEQYLSFSGIKTAVNHHLKSLKKRDTKIDQDLCASLQNIIVKTLIEKTAYFFKKNSYRSIALSGGVAMNSLLRKKITEFCEREKVNCAMASHEFCTDNGAMVGYLALFRKPLKNLENLETRPTQKIQARQLYNRT